MQMQALSRTARSCQASSRPTRSTVVVQSVRGSSEAPAGSKFFASITAGLVAASVLLAGVPPVHALNSAETQKVIAEYLELETSGRFGKGASSKALDDFRAKHRLRRGADGRVQLRSSKGEWFQVRLDMEVPGTMLLRDSKGYVFALQTESISQIDLSDDIVVLLMFNDGEWEQQMSPLEFTGDDGATQQLKLEDKEFRDIIGLLNEVQGDDAPAPASKQLQKK